MRKTVLTSMLVAGLLCGAARPAAAGPVGDAVTAFGGWIQRFETWAAETWDQYLNVSNEEIYAPDLIRLLVHSPDRIETIAESAGFILVGFALPLDHSQSTKLRFRFHRSLSIDERRTLSGKMKTLVNQQSSVPNAALENALLKILTNAADWRETGDRMGYTVYGVTITVGETVHAHLDLVHPGGM